MAARTLPKPPKPASKTVKIPVVTYTAPDMELPEWAGDTFEPTQEERALAECVKALMGTTSEPVYHLPASDRVQDRWAGRAAYFQIGTQVIHVKLDEKRKEGPAVGVFDTTLADDGIELLVSTLDTPQAKVIFATLGDPADADRFHDVLRYMSVFLAEVVYPEENEQIDEQYNMRRDCIALEQKYLGAVVSKCLGA